MSSARAWPAPRRTTAETTVTSHFIADILSFSREPRALARPKHAAKQSLLVLLGHGGRQGRRGRHLHYKPRHAWIAGEAVVTLRQLRRVLLARSIHRAGRVVGQQMGKPHVVAGEFDLAAAQ